MHDLRVAVRELSSAPIVTAVAILSLALGIGANTAIFSIVNSLLLRPHPVIEPQRLVVVSDARFVNRGFPAAWSYGIWDQIRRRATPFDAACAWWTGAGAMLVLVGVAAAWLLALRASRLDPAQVLRES